MNCAECEQLFDAYLDGELSGSLRLEFDAHRIRCTRCQQTLAMLESVGDVIGSNAGMPALSDDFTDAVMSRIEARSPRRSWLRPSRRVVVVGVALQAAAVLLFALLFPWEQQATPVPQVDPAPMVVADEQPAGFDFREAYRNYIVDRIDAVRSNLSSDIHHLASAPLQLNVPDEVARASADLADSSPLSGLLRALVPPTDNEQAEATPDADGQYAL